MKGNLCVLSGGTGTPKLLQGLVKLVRPDELSIIVNTADDVVVGGAYVSPDIDAVLYTLAGLIDEDKWYGIKDDTYSTYESRRKRGLQDLLRLGDRDRANAEARARLLSKGNTLSCAVNMQRTDLGVLPKVHPMTDSKVTTTISTPAGTKEFQEYWVRDGGRDEVLGVEFSGISDAEMSGGARNSLELASSVIIGPSNPVTSIGPIIQIRGVKEILADKFVLAISPLRGGAPFSGPAGSLLRGLGHEISPLTVAGLYGDFLDYLIIDHHDAPLAGKIEGEFGVGVGLADIFMKTPEDKFKLAQTALAACREGERDGR